MTPFAELVAATNFSFLRGASHAHEMVGQAAELGLAAIGIADRNTLAGVVRAHTAAKEHKIRLLVGARLVTTDGFEAACYPTDRAAYGRLCRLLTAGNRRAVKGQCHFSFEEMIAASEGQIFIVLPPRQIAPGFAERLDTLAAAARGRVYLGAVFAYRGDERRRLGELDELAARRARRSSPPTTPIYHHPGRKPLADVLACIREKCTIAQAGYRLEANAERHLKGGAEMARLFARYPQAVARSLEIAERIRFDLEELRYEYPDEPVPPGKTPQAYLEELTWEHAARHYPDGMPDKVRALLVKELALIARLDYARYFLTVYDIVRFARSKAILCQGRGSAANSAVCFCLGITAVNPIEIDLLFERFISADRREPPDIDVDFEHERREEVIQYLYAPLRPRARRHLRHRHPLPPAHGHPRGGQGPGPQGGRDGGPRRPGLGRGRRRDPRQAHREAGLDPANPAIRQAIGLARQLLGFPRHLSQHVGGFVLTRERLDETVPIHNGAMPDRTFLEWDKDDIDALGMLKVDVLALGMLTCIRKGFDLIERHYGRTLTLATVPREDAAVYEMLSPGRLGRRVPGRDPSADVDAAAPQAAHASTTSSSRWRSCAPARSRATWCIPICAGAMGIEPVDYPFRGAARRCSAKTLGVPLFQEQAMQIAIVAAGFTPDEADKLRRAMATFRHIGTIHTFREKFIAGMVGNGYEREFAERCFSQIEGFGEYGFPESHAASFAHLVYVSSWIKRHYPDVFCAAILNSQPMGFYAPAQLVRDAREHGVEVRHPDINASDWDCTLEPHAPLSPLRGEDERHGLARHRNGRQRLQAS